MAAQFSSTSLLALLLGGAGLGLIPQCQAPVSHVVVDGSQECSSCHQNEYVKASRPQHLGKIGSQCQECHVNEYWSPARGSNHSWELSGAHASTSCDACHTGSPKLYEGTAGECVDCHSELAQQVEQPSHTDFSTDCGDCHSSEAWDQATLDHEWPLEGAHAEAGCADCHTGTPPIYTDASSDCVSCHQADRDFATNPTHTEFSNDCSSCHSTTSWEGADFEHTQQFPLQGGHAFPECGECHTGSPAVFDGLSSNCVNCHQQDFDTSPFEGHDAFPTSCQDCHTIDAWTPASGGQHPENRFSTRGDHNFGCNDCHNSALGTPNAAANTDCVGCHEGEHTLARMDREHIGEVRNYPTGNNRSQNFCLQCHADGRE